ncbi:MAG: helix-turn-helix transcriptional regulator [Alphaproteobacteria bacterium]|nr:helix-turn-helix transcriptional regulator [Alphaproteobacteria bacterium]
MTNKRDREKLRARVKAALERSGTTQKDLESAQGWSSGTLSRVFSGKKNPDEAFLRALADQLGLAPVELVGGTAFSALVVDDRTVEAAPERDVLPETTEESRGTPDVTQESEAQPVAEEPETTVPSAPVPEPEPESEAAPEAAAPAEPASAPVAEEPAKASPPPDRGPQPEWDPPPEPCKRKRDIPLRMVKWVVGLVFGD